MHLKELILEVRDPQQPKKPAKRWVAAQMGQSEDKLVLKCRHFTDLREQGWGTQHGADISRTWLDIAEGSVLAVRIAGPYSNGEIVLPEAMRSYRIGSWIISQSIEWAQQWPDHAVHPIMISDVDATPDNKERRNRFWQSCGFRFEDIEVSRSYSLPMKVEDLRLPDKWRENIKIYPLDRFHEKCRHDVKQLDQEIDLAFWHFQDLDQQMSWLYENAVRYAFLGGLLISCNPPTQKDAYQTEEPESTLPDQLPANAGDTLGAYIRVLTERQYRLRSLTSSATRLEETLREIQSTPFAHLARCLRDSFYVRLVASLIGIGLLVWLAL